MKGEQFIAEVRNLAELANDEDARYMMELVEPLRDLGTPMLLLWGEADEVQPLSYAERFEREMPNARLVAVPGARHIPMEYEPEQVAEELARFFGGRLP